MLLPPTTLALQPHLRTLPDLPRAPLTHLCQPHLPPPSTDQRLFMPSRLVRGLSIGELVSLRPILHLIGPLLHFLIDFPLLMSLRPQYLHQKWYLLNIVAHI